MNNKKEVFTALLWPLLYILGMGLSNFIIYNHYHIEYGNDEYIRAMLPFLAMLAAGTMVFLYVQKRRLTPPWKERGKLPLLLLILLPLVAMSLYYLLISRSFTFTFMAPLVATLLVGIAEETMFRRILFIRLLQMDQDRNFKKPLLISAGCFSLLHAVNMLGGAPIPQVLMQLAVTFIAGLFYVLLYDYTRNIYLLILMHFLWDYILFSGATKQIPVYTILMSILQGAQIIIILVLLVKKWRHNASPECI